MSRHRIAISELEARSASVDSTRVMYGAADGEVYARFLVRYSFSEEFTMLLPHLKAEGIVPLIYTRDPNITGDFLRILTFGEDVIRVMKRLNPRVGEEKVYRRVSAGIVTLGNKMDAINMVLLSKKYIGFQASVSVFELVSMILGAVIAVLFAVTGSFNIPSAVYLVLQIVWCIYLGIRTRNAFPKKKEDKEN